MKTRLFSILLTLLILVITGCKPSISEVIQDTMCIPPCWKSIVPGQTSQQEATSILNKLSDVDNRTLRIMSVAKPNDSIYLNFIPKTGDIGARLFFKNDTVLAINFVPKNLSLGTTIEYLGEPESILAIHHQDERSYVSVFLDYQSKGIVLLLELIPYQSGEKVILSPDTEVQGFWYFDPNSYHELMTSPYIAGLYPNFLEQNTHQWVGYGDISAIIVEHQ